MPDDETPDSSNDEPVVPEGGGRLAVEEIEIQEEMERSSAASVSVATDRAF